MRLRRDEMQTPFYTRLRIVNKIWTLAEVAYLRKTYWSYRFHTILRRIAFGFSDVFYFSIYFYLLRTRGIVAYRYIERSALMYENDDAKKLIVDQRTKALKSVNLYTVRLHRVVSTHQLLSLYLLLIHHSA